MIRGTIPLHRVEIDKKVLPETMAEASGVEAALVLRTKTSPLKSVALSAKNLKFRRYLAQFLAQSFVPGVLRVEH